MRHLTPPSMLPNATRASGSSTLRNTARLRAPQFREADATRPNTQAAVTATTDLPRACPRPWRPSASGKSSKA